MIFHVWLDVRLIKQLIDPTLMTTAAAPELSWRLCHYHTINSTNMFTLSRWWQKRWQMSINQLPRIYVGLKYYQLGTKIHVWKFTLHAFWWLWNRFYDMSKTLVCMRNPKILTGVQPRIFTQCMPKPCSYEFWKAIQATGFGCQKNRLLNKYPKILTCVKPGIFIQCRPKVFALVENPKILTSQVGLGCFVSKNMVLITKYTKILTGVKPGILIWC